MPGDKWVCMRHCILILSTRWAKSTHKVVSATHDFCTRDKTILFYSVSCFAFWVSSAYSFLFHFSTTLDWRAWWLTSLQYPAGGMIATSPILYYANYDTSSRYYYDWFAWRLLAWCFASQHWDVGASCTLSGARHTFWIWDVESAHWNEWETRWSHNATEFEG